jgi:integrase/recombinase XerD
MLLSSGVKARKRGAIMNDHCGTVVTGTSEELVEHYRGWLVAERSLAPATVKYYVSAARLFLSECGGLELKSLTLGEVTRFVVRQCPRFSAGHAKNLVTGLRSLLGYLYLEGLTDRQLAPAVPTPSGWHGSNLPKGLGADALAALLAVGDDATAVGRRDHAIVVLLARLGLRAGEVCSLTLDDIDWSQGEIVVRGKGSRTEALPMPVDVGEALVGYLRTGRPKASCRSLFLRAHAPMVGLSSSSICGVVHRACIRAGVPPVGAHRLRHSAATAMLRAGASLEEVGQVLRQRSTQVTALYAKVDFVALATLALPWPGDAA